MLYADNIKFCRKGLISLSKIDNDLKAMEEELKKNQPVKADSQKKTDSTVNNSPNVQGGSDHELLEFFMGFLLLGGGVYWVLNSFEVSSSWGMGYYSLFGMRITGGVMLIPLLIGIGLLFFMEKKVIGGCVTALGLLIILISLLSSVSFRARYTTLWVYVLMFGMIAAGAGLLVKTLFKKR